MIGISEEARSVISELIRKEQDRAFGDDEISRERAMDRVEEEWRFLCRTLPVVKEWP